MSLTRRKLFGWVAALFGGAVVAKVAREETETVEYGPAKNSAMLTNIASGARGHHIDGDACTRCGKHRAICALRACDPPDEYVHGVTPGWTFRKYEGDA